MSLSQYPESEYSSRLSGILCTVLLALFNSKALKHGTVSAVASMRLSIYGKFTPRSSKSIYIINSMNLPSASPVRWRVSSFVPSPSSILAYMPEKLPEINSSKLSL